MDCKIAIAQPERVCDSLYRMNEEIGSVAGAIWRILCDKGEMGVAALKKSAASKGSEAAEPDFYTLHGPITT